MKSESIRHFLGYVFFVVLVLLISGGSYFRWLDSFELQTLDYRFRLRPKIPTTDKVVIIEIGDDTIEKLGRFPFKREYHATLIQALTEYGAEAIVFDILFSEPADGDDQLQAAISLGGNVYLPYVLQVEQTKKYNAPSASEYIAPSLKDFTVAARGTGHINIIPDIDGKFRRVPLLVSYKHSLRPYLSFLLSCDYLGISQEQIKLVPGRYILCGKDFKIPLDINSNLIVNYSGRWGEYYQHYSYADVLQSYIAGLSGERPLLDLDVFKNKICVIGLTAVGSTDLHPNPFQSLYPAVGIHADVFNSIVNKKFIVRAKREVNLAILLVLSFAVALAVFRTRPLKGFCMLLAAISIFVLVNIILFNIFGLWLNLLYPVFIMAFVYLSCSLYKYVMEWKKRLVLENELQIAKKIQESFLPKKMPGDKRIDVSAAMLTARQVGGDLYDFLEFGSGKLGVMIGDVSGKGIPASLFMTMVVGAFKFFAAVETTPSDTLANLNEKLIRESSSQLFVTMFYAIFDFNKQTMMYANGGHLPVLYLTKNKPPAFLDVKEGCPLGIIEGSYSCGQIKFNRQDTFVFYSDGITEAMNARNELYENERLLSVVEKNKGLSSKDLLQAIEADVQKFEPKRIQHDDITLIVVKIT